jgi:hypothetical protein
MDGWIDREMVLKTWPMNAMADLTVHTHLKSLINGIKSQELIKCNLCLIHKLLMCVVYYLKNIKQYLYLSQSIYALFLISFLFSIPT